MSKKIVLALLQIAAAVIIGIAGYHKLVGNPMPIFIFTQLGIEPNGRIVIGIIEVFSALLLLTRNYGVYGAILTGCTMLGAFIAHASVLGISVYGDGGSLALLMVIEILLCSLILVIKKRQIPIIGDLLDDRLSN